MSNRLLLVDDNIVDTDPGEFDSPPPVDSTAGGVQYLGQMGYFIYAFQDAGFEVVVETDAERAVETVQKGDFCLAVLDIMLPWGTREPFTEAATASGLRTGFVLAEEIHRLRPTLPIWLLSQIVPDRDSRVNEATVDDLVERRVIQGNTLKMSVTNPDDFARGLWERYGR